MQTKPSSSGQTCLAGDQIQLRHENSKMDSGLTAPAASAELLATTRTNTIKALGRWGLGSVDAKGDEAPHPGHSQSRWALPGKVWSCVPQGRAGASPSPLK